MIIKIKENGKIENYADAYFVQGSHKSGLITLFAPISSSAMVLLNFEILDDAVYSGIMQYQSQEIDGYSVWAYPIGSGITQYAGTIQVAVQINIGDQIIKTPAINITILESVEVGFEIEDPTTFNELWEMINRKVDYDYLFENDKIKLELLPPIDCGSYKEEN